jgi:hypothetical protein
MTGGGAALPLEPVADPRLVPRLRTLDPALAGFD